MRKISCSVCILFISISAYSQSLFPVQDTLTGLFGYKNAASFKWGISPRFESAEAFIKGRAIVSEKGYFGLINKKGVYLASPKYEQLEGEEFFTFALNDTFGILNSAGKTILSGDFTHLYYDPLKGSAIVMQKDLYGYWDTLGNYIAPVSRYELAFESSLAYFNTGKTQGFIDRKGNKIIEIDEGDVWDVSPYGYLSSRKKKECVYDSLGKVIGGCDFEKIIQMREALIVYVKEGKYGIMNYKGENLSFGEYDYISPFNERGISVVKKENKFGLINESLQTVLPLENQLIEDYGKEYNRFFGKYKKYFKYTIYKKNDHFGVINDSGRVVIEPQYDMAMIEGDYLLKYIHKDVLGANDLRTLQKMPLTQIYDFINDKTVFCIENNGTKCGIANKDGKIIVMPSYQSITPTVNGYAIAKTYHGAGILDTAGVLVVPLVYADIRTLDEVYKQYYKNSGDAAWDGYLYLTTRKNKAGIAQESGKLVVDTVYNNVSAFDIDGESWFVQDKKGWRIINKKGKKLSVKLSAPSIFNQGAAIAKKGTRYGLINPEGKAIVPFKYDEITEEPFGNYYFRADSLWGIMKRSGVITEAPAFRLISPFSLEHAFAKKENNWGTINSDGIFHQGFEALKTDSSNYKSINNTSVLSFSYNTIAGYDEISLDLIQTYDRPEVARKINSRILNSLENILSASNTEENIVLVYPPFMDDTTFVPDYRGAGVEIINSTKNSITLNYFIEEFDREKEINKSDEKTEVYLIEENDLKRLNLAELFSSPDNLHVLNKIVLKKSREMGFMLSGSFPRSEPVFDPENFMLLDNELALRLNEEAFTGNKEFTKNVGVLIPYSEIRSIAKQGGPLRDFYE